MGAKHTSALIPLCHNILLSKVHVALSLAPEAAAVDVRAEATTVGPTGVEMEALTAAAVAALTVYDMCKVGGVCDLLCTLALHGWLWRVLVHVALHAVMGEGAGQPRAAQQAHRPAGGLPLPSERTASTW